MNLLNLFNRQNKTFDVSSVKYKKPIDEQIVYKLIGYIQLSLKDLSRSGLHKIMVGIFDTNSLIAAALLKQSLADNVLAMVIDFGTDYTNHLVDICNRLALNTYILKRGAAYQIEITTYHLHKPSDIKNFYYRFINYHISIQASHMKAAVIDTVDKSDRLLNTRPQGFYGHFRPFYSLYKTEAFDLASLLEIPVDNPQNYQDLPYPKNLVLTYDKIDPVLFLLTEKQLTPEQISQDFNIDLHWLKRLKSRIDKQLSQTTISQFII